MLTAHSQQLTIAPSYRKQIAIVPTPLTTIFMPDSLNLLALDATYPLLYFPYTVGKYDLSIHDELFMT